jgi:hypothetical protein
MTQRGIVVILGAIFGLGAMVVHAQTGVAGASAQAEPSGATLPSGATINAELKETLDSKKVKPGDLVKLKTTEAYKYNEQIVLAKGTELLGHVTQATIKEKGQSESSLGIAFDRAVFSNGQEMPLNATIQAIASGEMGENAAGALASPGMGAPGGGAAPSGGRPGMSGGGSPAQNPGYQPNLSTNPIPGSGGASADSVNPGGQLTPDSHGVFGLDGLTLQPAAGDSTQGSMILSKGKSVHLYSGTRILLLTK